MNVQLPVTIDEIESCRDLLPDGFIEETWERQKKLGERRRQSLKSVASITKSLKASSEGLLDLSKTFDSSSQSYAMLQKNCESNKIAYNELGTQMRNLAESLKKAAESIQSNLGHNKKRDVV